jgi:hypothetical protein
MTACWCARKTLHFYVAAMVLLRTAEGTERAFCASGDIKHALHASIRQSENYAFTFYGARPIITITGFYLLEAFLSALFVRFFIEGQKSTGTAASGMGCA